MQEDIHSSSGVIWSNFQGLGLIEGSEESWDEREACVEGVKGSGKTVYVGLGFRVWGGVGLGLADLDCLHAEPCSAVPCWGLHKKFSSSTYVAGSALNVTSILFKESWFRASPRSQETYRSLRFLEKDRQELHITVGFVMILNASFPLSTSTINPQR